MPYEKFFPKRRGKVIITFGKPICFKKSDLYKDATKVIESNFKSIV